MTAIIVLKAQKGRGLFCRLRRFFKKPKSVPVTVCELNYTYLLCECEFSPRCGEREFERVRRAFSRTLGEHGCERFCICGEGAHQLRRALFLDGFLVPSAEKLKRQLFKKMLQFTVENVMGQGCSRAALVDYDGAHYSEQLLRDLCEQFRYVTLVTANSNYFEGAIARIMDDFGLAVQVSCSVNEIKDCGLYVLASGGDRLLYSYSRNRENTVISMSPDISLNYIGLKHVITSPKVALSPQLRDAFPPEISDYQAAVLMAADGELFEENAVSLTGVD